MKQSIFALQFSLLLLSFLGGTSTLFAQPTAVTSVVQVTRFSTQIEDYDDPGNVFITLLSTDIRPEYEVILRINLSGPGYSVPTRENFLSMPITLRRNIPTVLTGAQLREYFNPANLVTGGLSLETLQQGGGRLPEGPVSLCVEVYDLNRFFDPPVSNTSCANGFILQHRPPLLTEPMGDVVASFPQQLRFQWQPQHAGFIARYTLEVYEDILPGMGDNLLIENTQPLLRQTTNFPFFLMTNTAPLLAPGTRYLVRVRAEDIMGQNTFLNEGWSDVHSFTIITPTEEEAPCRDATGFAAVALNENTVGLSWDAQAPLLAWELTLPDGEILSLADTTVSYTDTGLELGGTYTYILCAVCADSMRYCTKQEVVIPAAPATPDCLDHLAILRTDSTANSLSLSWTYDARQWAAEEEFQLIWQLADASGSAETATLSYGSGAFTITDLVPFAAYTIKVCTVCRNGERVCRELPPYGACQVAYQPYLADIAGDHALLAWEPAAGEPLRPTEVRIKPTVSPNWEALPPGQVTSFDLSALELPAEAVAETGLLHPYLTYVAQIRTLCSDSTWSVWSEPVVFNLNCAVDDQLWVQQLTDHSANILVLAYANVDFYTFEYRPLGEEEWTVVSDLSSPLLELSELSSSTTYELRFRYWCSRGVWSDYSSVSTFTTLPPCLPPTELAVDILDIDAAQISWTPYPDALRTNIRYQSTSGNYYYALYPAPWQTAVTEENNHLLEDLQAGARYVYELRSECALNQSEWTAIEEILLPCPPPQTIRVSDITYESAIITLEGLSASSGSARLEYRPLGGSEWKLATATYGIAFLANLDDLTTYEVRVQATCYSGGLSEYSDLIQFRTLVECLVPEGLVANDVQPFSAAIDWDVTGTITEWELRLSPPQWDGIITVPNPTEAMTPTSRDRNTTHNNSPENNDSPTLGDGAISGGNTPDGNAPPGNVPFGNAPFGNNPAANDGAAPPITLEGINRALAPFADWQRFTVTEPHKFLEELRDNTPHQVVVRANCPEFGWTEYSDTLAFLTLADCVKPEWVGVDQIYQKTVRVSWQPRPYPDYTAEHQVLIQSLYPLPAQVLEEMETQRSGGNHFSGAVPLKLQQQLNEYAIADLVYQDSVITPDLNTTLTGLRPNTYYRVAVKSRCDNFGWTDYTEWIVFRTDECAKPENIVEQALSRSTMQLSWDASYGINDYELRYKLNDTPGADWITHLTADSFYVIENLLSNQIYDYQISERCQGDTGIKRSPQDTFLMRRPSLNNGFYVCGVPGDADLSNQTPLAELLAGDTIMAFDFPVVIKAAEGGNGYFRGQGDIELPYFNKAKFSFVFDNIFVNDEYRMVGGYLQATGFGVEVLPPWADSLLANVIAVLEDLDEHLDEQQQQILQDLIQLGANGDLPPDLQADLQAVLDCFAAAQTSEEIAACNEQMQVVIQQVNQFLEELYDGDFQLVFRQNDEQFYGFDAKEGTAPDDWYESRTISGEDYSIPYKSVRAGLVEKVDAQPLDGNSLDSIYFQQRSATPLPFTVENEVATVSFQGLPGEAYYLSALKDSGVDSLVDHVVGLLSVVPYEQLTPRIVLVPLSNSAANGVLVNELEQELQRIYAQAVVRPSVTLDAVFSPEGYTPPLRAVASGLLSNYTPQMNDIIRAYEDQPGYDPNTYYLFLTDDYEATDRAGFMPRGRQFGFLYMGNTGTGEALARTLAHEIGHGAFVLEHSFDAHPDHLPQHQTDNLMDYANGTHLYKWQWDLIHDPVNAPFLEGDESGEYVTLSENFIREILVEYADGDKFVFLNNVGDRVTLDTADVVELWFATGGERYVGTNKFLPAGSLLAFTIKVGEAENTYVNCIGGSYIKQLNSTTIKEAIANPDCSDNGYPENRYTLYQDYEGDPIILRYTRKDATPVINVVKIDHYTNSGDAYTFDMYLNYFFRKEGDNYLEQGAIINFPPNTNLIDISPEYSYPIYLDFIEAYPELAEYDELSSFYIGALAFIFANNQNYVDNCSLQDYPMELFRNLVKPFSGVHSTDEQQIQTPSLITQYISEDAAPFFFNNMTEQERANCFNFLEDKLNRIDKVAYYQQELDNTDATDMFSFVALMLELDNEIEVCELELLTIPYDKNIQIIKGFFNFFGNLSITSLFENKFERILLTLINKITPENYCAFLDFLKTETFFVSVGGISTSTPAWKVFIDRIDNGFTDQNGLELLQQLSIISNGAYNDPSCSYYSNAINLISLLGSAGMGGQITPDVYEQLGQKIIPFEYHTLLKRAGLEILSAYQSSADLFNWITSGSIGEDFSAYITTSVDVDPTTGTLSIQHQVESARFFDQLIPPQNFTGLDPFEPIILDPTSSFRNVREINVNNLKFLPACVLYYLNDQARTKTAMDAAEILGSVAVISLGNPAGLTTFGRLIYQLDRGAALLALSAEFVDINQTDDPTWLEVRDLLRQSSLALGFSSLVGQAWFSLANPTKTQAITMLSDVLDPTNTTVTTRANSFNDVTTLLLEAPPLQLGMIRNNPSLSLSLQEVLLQGYLDALKLGATAGQLNTQALIALINILRTPVDDLVFRLMTAGATNEVLNKFVLLPTNELKVAFLDDVEFAGPAFWGEFNAIPDGGGIRAWEGLLPSEILSRNLDALREANYLLSNGFTKADLNGFAAQVDNVFAGTRSTLTNRITAADGFSLIHSDAELQAILLRAKSLDLPVEEIDDLLFISCKTSKQIPANELMLQMDNWVNVVKTNGYPYLFNSITEFDNFGTILKQLATDFGIATDKFNMQGSSLRKSNLADINDFDIAYKVDDATFNSLVDYFYLATTNPNTKQKILDNAANGKILGHQMYQPGSTSGSFVGRFKNNLDTYYNQPFQQHFNKSMDFDIQVTIIKDGADLDISPFLKIQ